MLQRWMVLVAGAVGLLAAPVPALAATIEVATVNLALVGNECGANQTADEQQQTCTAQFTLQYLWLDGLVPGPAPAPIVSGGFTVDGSGFLFFDVSDLSPADQFPTTGVPPVASAWVSFEFGGTLYTLDEQSFALTGLFDINGDVSPEGETLSFRAEIPAAVPEGSTLLPTALGVLILILFVTRQLIAVP